MNVELQKKLIPAVIIAVVAVAVIAVVAAIFIFSGTSLPKYAPKGTDIIIYVNSKKLAKSKVWPALKKTILYEQMEKASKKDGYTIDEAMQGEACFFLDVTTKGIRSVAIYRGKNSVAAKIFAAIKKNVKKNFGEEKKLYANQLKRYEERKKNYEKQKKYYESKNQPLPDYLKAPKAPQAPSFSADKIGGKEAFTAYTGYGIGKVMILLDKDTFQFASGKKSEIVATPLKKGSSELAKAIDTGAIVSVAYKHKLSKELKAFLKTENGKMVKDVEAGLKTVTLSIKEVGDDLEFKLVGEYESTAAAKKSGESLTALRTFGKKKLEGKDDDMSREGLESLDAVKIDTKGKQVVISLKVSEESAVKWIENVDKQTREQLKRAEEVKKQLEEQHRQLEEQRKRLEEQRRQRNNQKND